VHLSVRAFINGYSKELKKNEKLNSMRKALRVPVMSNNIKLILSFLLEYSSC